MKKLVLFTLLLTSVVMAASENVWDEIPTAPTELTNLLSKSSVNLTVAAQAWIAGALNEDYSSWGENAQKSVVVAYGLFNLGNYDYCEWMYRISGRDFDTYACREDLENNFFGFMYKVYSNGALRQTAYTWLRPVWTKAIGEMDDVRKDTVAEAVNVGLKYAIQLRDDPEFLACETQYYNTQIAEYGPDRNHFAWTGPDASCKERAKQDEPYRKIEAWVFRRVQMKHMTAEKMVEWFAKIEKELL